MSDYFTYTNLTPNSVARSTDVDSRFQSIETGLGYLPAKLKLQQDRVTYVDAGGTANALTATLDPAPPALVAGLRVRLKLASANTGPATLNVNGLGAVAIKRNDGEALVASDLLAGSVVDMTYDGTNFRLTSGVAYYFNGADYVTTQTAQTVTGAKTFSAATAFGSNVTISGSTSSLVVSTRNTGSNWSVYNASGILRFYDTADRVSFSGTGLNVTGEMSSTAGIKTTGNAVLRFENGSSALPASGAAGIGLEVVGNSASGPILYSYDRTALAYVPLRLSGSSVLLQSGTTTIGTVSSTGFSVTGTGAFSGAVSTGALTATGGASRHILDSTAKHKIELKEGGVMRAYVGADATNCFSVMDSGFGTERFRVTQGGEGFFSDGLIAKGHFVNRGGTGAARFENNVTTAPVGATGIGVEIGTSGGTFGYLTSYDRTNNVYVPAHINGSTVNIQSSGTTVGAFSSTGLSVTGTGTFSSTLSASRLTATGYSQSNGTASSGAGKGLISSYDTGNDRAALISYDWDTAARKPLRLDGSQVDVYNASTLYASFTSTGFGCISATTASAANVYQASSGSELLRSTSSVRYKTNVHDLADADADKVLQLRPVTYTSKAEADDPARVHWGFIAEETDTVLPQLVHYDAEGRPDGMQYERVIVGLLNLVKRQDARIAALEAKLV